MAAGTPPRTGFARADLLAEMVELSRQVGADPEFVRAGGGNISAKAGGVLAIKPSGVPLATLTVDSLIELSLAPLLDALEPASAGESAPGSDEVLRIGEAARLSVADGRRPSVELLFHALIPEPIVLHTHPTTVNALTCSTGGRELAEQILGDRGALWIPYADPGLPLARAIRAERAAYQARTGETPPRAILLQNHGLIVSGDSAGEVSDTSYAVAARIAGHAAGRDHAPGDTVRLAGSPAGEVVDAIVAVLRTRPGQGAGSGVAVLHDGATLALDAAGSELGRQVARGGPLTPDQIVYAGSWPLVVDPVPPDPPAAAAAVRDALERRAEAGIEAPIIVLVAGLGLFAVGGTEAQADTARELYLDAVGVAFGAHRLGGIRPLAPAERLFIERWEAEAYRRQVASNAG